MGYWIFQDETSGQCTAINDDTLGCIAIGDELGELLHEGPMPLMIAKMYISKRGGRLVDSGSQALDLSLDCQVL